MYETESFKTILQRMLDRVPSDLDKREGSVIYDALAPAAVELASVYAELDVNLELSYGDTATGVYLDRRVAEHGVTRLPATKATRLGLFYGASNAPIDVPLGSRYAIGNVRYQAIERLAAGQYVLECETAGVIGNQGYGTLLPIDFISNLVRAELTDIIAPGQEAETDSALRKRFFAVINEQPFGGNVTDYKQKLSAIPGVGGVKVFPVWQGGGTVRCVLIASDYSAPSAGLVDDVQTAIDPTVNSGEGIGFAPIGHQVTIAAVQNVTIDVETTLTLASGVLIGQVQEEIEEVIEAYLLSLRIAWADEEQLIVRVSQLEARILNVPGVTDISNTLLNGTAANVPLNGEQIPVLGTVTLHD